MKNNRVTLRVSKIKSKENGIFFRITTSQEGIKPMWLKKETSKFFDAAEEQIFQKKCTVAIRSLVSDSLFLFVADEKCKFKMIFPNDLYGEGEVSFTKEKGSVVVHYFDQFLKMNETEQEFFLNMFCNIEY